MSCSFHTWSKYFLNSMISCINGGHGHVVTQCHVVTVHLTTFVEPPVAQTDAQCTLITQKAAVHWELFAKAEWVGMQGVACGAETCGELCSIQCRVRMAGWRGLHVGRRGTWELQAELVRELVMLQAACCLYQPAPSWPAGLCWALPVQKSMT